MKFLKLFFVLVFSLGVFTSFGQPDDTTNSKSSITITSPDRSTVWSIPEKVTLIWSTDNIAASKSIRFFLVRNEMVVQELGSFKNDGFEEGIELAKNIGSGSRYQVVAIELFPDDKFSIAKKITPFFTIVNKASDERKKRSQLNNANTQGAETTPKNVIAATPKKKKTIQIKAPPASRDVFDGRKISYTKAMKFSSENISIKIWDHGKQDGDIVSIFLNGKAVVSKHELTYRKKEFKVKLNTSKANDLFLYAHNLGNSPPNTVSVEISDNGKSENIILNSDLKSCEAVMISVR